MKYAALILALSVLALSAITQYQHKQAQDQILIDSARAQQEAVMTPHDADDNEMNSEEQCGIKMGTCDPIPM